MLGQGEPSGHLIPVQTRLTHHGALRHRLRVNSPHLTGADHPTLKLPGQGAEQKHADRGRRLGLL